MSETGMYLDKANRVSRIVFLAVITMAFAILFMIDLPLVIFLSEHQDNFLLKALQTTSDYGHGGKYFAAAILFIIAGFTLDRWPYHGLPLNSKQLRQFGYFCLLALVVTGLVIVFLKWGFGRTRPTLMLREDIIGYLPFEMGRNSHWRSFPSGHTQTIFTVGFLFAVVLPRTYLSLVLMVCALTGFGRVALLVHWPSDILAGALTGWFIPWLLWVWLGRPCFTDGQPDRESNNIARGLRIRFQLSIRPYLRRRFRN